MVIKKMNYAYNNVNYDNIDNVSLPYLTYFPNTEKILHIVATIVLSHEYKSLLSSI